MVIRREYLDRVRKKSFWIGVLLFPLIMGGMMTVPALIAMKRTESQQRIAVIDATGKMGEPFSQQIADEKLKSGQPRYALEMVPVEGTVEETRKKLEPQAATGGLYGILTIEFKKEGKGRPAESGRPAGEAGRNSGEAGMLAGEVSSAVGGERKAEGERNDETPSIDGESVASDEIYNFYGKNVGDMNVINDLRSALRKAALTVRLERMQLQVDKTKLAILTAPIDLESFQISAGGVKKKDFGLAYLGTFGFVFILFMSVLLYGIAVMRGILEEKSNRIMEVLLASLTPDQLMTGKIIGIGLVGLTQMGVYLLVSLGVYAYGAAGRMQGELAAGLMDMPSPVKMAYLVVFFLLGYFMYTAMYAAVGAVCNSEQEAQNLQAPVQYMLMIPMITTIYFVMHPESNIATIVSLIPVFTPMVMFMRITLLTPPFWQIALSIVLMLGTIYLLFRGAAKVFRIGVLMHGKRPTIPEVLRWARS
jgi:ABC-2 type transport system permease protein